MSKQSLKSIIPAPLRPRGNTCGKSKESGKIIIILKGNIARQGTLTAAYFDCVLSSKTTDEAVEKIVELDPLCLKPWDIIRNAEKRGVAELRANA